MLPTDTGTAGLGDVFDLIDVLFVPSLQVEYTLI